MYDSLKGEALPKRRSRQLVPSPSKPPLKGSPGIMKYANIINQSYGYNITRLGNKKQDFEKSNIEFDDSEKYKYKIICKGCSQEFYRKRLNKNFTRKYRCGKCGSKFEVAQIR